VLSLVFVFVLSQFEGQNWKQTNTFAGCGAVNKSDPGNEIENKVVNVFKFSSFCLQRVDQCLLALATFVVGRERWKTKQKDGEEGFKVFIVGHLESRTANGSWRKALTFVFRFARTVESHCKKAWKKTLQ